MTPTRAAGLAWAASLLAAGGASGEPLGLRLEAGFRYGHNVTRAPQNSLDVLSDQSFALDLDQQFTVPLTDRTRLLVTGFVGGEQFLEFDRLSHLRAGAQATWQFRPSGEYGAPTYAVFARATGEQFGSTLRDGYRLTAGASVRLPLTDRIEASAAAAYHYRDASSAVFDQREGSLRLNLDYAAFGRGTLYAGGEVRRGDVVSTTRPSAAIASIAKALQPDDAFDDGVARTAYRLEATTFIATLGWNQPIGSNQSLDLSYRYVRSTPTESIQAIYTPGPWYGVQTARYLDHQVALSYLIRF